MLKATLPIALNGTETVTIRGSYATIKRGAVVLWHGDLRPLSVAMTGPMFAASINAQTLIWEEPKMPGITLTPTKVTRDDQSGLVRFNFSNGSERSLSWQQVENIANSFDQDGVWMENFLMAIAFRNSPDGANVTTIENSMLTCNLLADQKLVYTPPVN